jgi:hypothetical protein
VTPTFRDDFPAYLGEPRLQVPAILSLDQSESVLLYSWFRRESAEDTEPAEPGPSDGLADCLTSFARLRTAGDALQFARRFGPLELCDHDMPYWHSHPRAEFPASILACSWQVWAEKLDGQTVFYEPIESWLSLSRRVAAFLRLGRAIRAARPRPAQDWQTFLNDEPHSNDTVRFVADPPDHWAGKRLEADRLKLAHELASWTQRAGGDYLPVWEGSRPALRLTGSLFAVLCQQMFKTLAGTEQAVACDGCGVVYEPARRPAWNRNAYCAACRETVGPAMRRARFRERKQARIQAGISSGLDPG